MNLLTLELPSIPKLCSGKTSEIFDLGNSLLLVATDRISIGDYTIPNAIPRKGEALTRLSHFWFHKLDFVPNHLIEIPPKGILEKLRPWEKELSGRFMIVKKASPFPIKCIVHGYLAESTWKNYEITGNIDGQKLPAGLRQADKLPTPLFTSFKKDALNQSNPIGWNEFRSILGDDVALRLRKWSIDLYEHGQAFAARRGIIIAYATFEFGIVDDEIVLIAQCLTPDSSCFWPAESWKPGENPPSFDKEYIYNYLETLAWDKRSSPPKLSDEIVMKTSEKYIAAYTQLTSLRL